jgi:hypothetical protein
LDAELSKSVKSLNKLEKNAETAKSEIDQATDSIKD